LPDTFRVVKSLICLKMAHEKMALDPKESDLEAPPAAAATDLVIDSAAEARLIRKLDLWLAPMMVLFFLVAYLDRSNIGKSVPFPAHQIPYHMAAPC